MTDSEPAAATETPPPASVDQADLPLKALARAILAREIRPRIASVRRLAEAVLEPKNGKNKKKHAKKKAAKAVRKLARIPGQNAH
ncbi:MAG: hypothetical protein ABIT10_07620 [Alteraurantiacibacter sp.]